MLYIHCCDDKNGNYELQSKYTRIKIYLPSTEMILVHNTANLLQVVKLKGCVVIFKIFLLSFIVRF